MPDRYCVGSPSNTIASWSLTDSGAGGASIPGVLDTAYLTANSPSLTIDAALSCAGFDMTGYAATLTVSAAMTIGAVGLTVRGTIAGASDIASTGDVRCNLTTWTGYTGVITTSGSPTPHPTAGPNVVFNGGLSIVPNAGGHWRSLALDGNTQLVQSKAWTVAGALDLSDGTLVDAGGTWTLTDGGSLNTGANTMNPLTISGTVRFATGVKASAINFGRATVALTGTLDGTGMTPTNTGAVIVGGTVDDVNAGATTALLHLWPAATGTGNTNVTELSPSRRAMNRRPRRAA